MEIDPICMLLSQHFQSLFPNTTVTCRWVDEENVEIRITIPIDEIVIVCEDDNVN